MTNYPGGVAITRYILYEYNIFSVDFTKVLAIIRILFSFSRFHKLLRNEPFVHIHICNLAAQTGVTRYTQINERWMYSKNESLPPDLLQDYTHLLIEAKSKYSSNLKSFAQTHDILDSIESFSQIAMNYRLMPPVKIKTKPAIFILERKDFREFPHGHKLGISESSVLAAEESIMSDETIMEVTNYENFVENGSKETEEIGTSVEEEEKTADLNISDKENTIIDIPELIKEEIEVPTVEVVPEEKEPIVQEEIKVELDKSPKLPKAKKAFDELKSLRIERKKKAIEKIKTETRKEVVESAKEKLKEIMKRHKNIADELSESIMSDITSELEEKDGRGDIPESEFIPEVNQVEDIEKEAKKEEEHVKDTLNIDVTNHGNETIDSIVDEVILRLIDRKIYDDKTKPEDIKPDDRLMIQKIVEEVVSEKIKQNYSNAESK